VETSKDQYAAPLKCKITKENKNPTSKFKTRRQKIEQTNIASWKNYFLSGFQAEHFGKTSLKWHHPSNESACILCTLQTYRPVDLIKSSLCFEAQRVFGIPDAKYREAASKRRQPHQASHICDPITTNRLNNSSRSAMAVSCLIFPCLSTMMRPSAISLDVAHPTTSFVFQPRPPTFLISFAKVSMRKKAEKRRSEYKPLHLKLQLRTQDQYPLSR
jgi:hypothetical protein